MNEELEKIVQNMMDAGESEDSIAEVIKAYTSTQAKESPDEPTEESLDPPKKKVSESASTGAEVDFLSGGSQTSSEPQSVEEIPDNIVDEPMAELYKQYKEAGAITNEQISEIDAEIESQEKGQWSFWEKASAVAEGIVRNGDFTPVYQYDTKESLVNQRELKNKVNFLENLPEDVLTELKTYAGNKVSELEDKNLNILFQNKMIEERGKKLSNELKTHVTAIKQLQSEGREIPPEGLSAYEKVQEELRQLQVSYNKNFDIIENNTEDVGDLYEEISLLKKNYGGFDYYKDIARLTTADMGAGIATMALSTRDIITDKTGITPPVSTPFEKEDVREFQEEVSKQRSGLGPQMSVKDIESVSDLGAWAVEQAATQLPTITVLAATGGSAGLGVLGVSSAGQKMAELEQKREFAKEESNQIQSFLESGELISEQELDAAEKRLEELKYSDLSDDSVYLSGLGVGALEILTEKVSLGVLSKGKRAFTAAKKAGGATFKEFRKGVARHTMSGAQEGSAEFANQLGNNLLDIMYLNDPDVHVFDGVVDALASGSALGFGMSSFPAAMGMGSKVFMPKGRTSQVKEKVQKVMDLDGELVENGENMPAEAKKAIEKKSAELKKEVSLEIKEVFDGVSRMEKADIEALINLDKTANKLSQKARGIEQSEISEGVKKELLQDVKNDIDDVARQKQEILSKDHGDKTETEGLTEQVTEQPTEQVDQPSEQVADQAGADTSAPKPVKRPSLDQVSRTIKIINPFKQSKPLAEIPLGDSFNSKADYLSRKLVDRFFPIKTAQKNLEAERGTDLPKDENFRQAEVLMHGKSADQLKSFKAELDEVLSEVANSSLVAPPKKADGTKKSKSDRLSDYLMARHAKERNAHIRSLPLKSDTDKVNDAGSGMTDEAAQEKLDSFKGKELEDVQKLAKRVDDIMQETRQIMFDGGLISKDNKKTLETYYDHYVPLQGFESAELESDLSTAFGLSLEVKGSETQKAIGRTTKADNVIANIVGFRNNMIVRAEKNRVMQTLYNMAKNNPDTDFWETFSKARPDVVRGMTSSGKVGVMPVNMANQKGYVGVKFKGEQHYIKFANAHLSEVINASSVEKVNAVTRVAGKFNRYMSTVLTAYDPDFILTNFFRDLPAAVLNLKAESDISTNTVKDKKLVSKTISGVFSSIRAIYKSERMGEAYSGKYAKYYKDFKESGAKTDFFYAKDVEGIKKDIQALSDPKSKASKVGSALKSVGKFVDDLNSSVENGVRLASFIAARESGVAKDDAAELAKELTINFNQKGEWGSAINSWFLFFNPAVQGTVRFSRAMGRYKRGVDDDGNVTYGLSSAQKVASAVAASSSLLALANTLMSGDDEDGVSFYAKIPDYEKERNLIMMNPLSDTGEYLKLPLPYGYNIISNVGTIATEVAMGVRGPGDGTGFMLASTLGAFSPIGVPKSNKDFFTGVVKTAAPSILTPAMEIATNEDYFLSTVYNETFPGATPRPSATMGRKSTNQYLKDVSLFLNEATGGSDFESGWLDMNPDKIEHVFEFLGGGAFKFVNRSAKTGSYLFKTFMGQDVEIKPREIPFLRKVYGSQSEYINKQIYYDRRIQLKQLKDARAASSDKSLKKFAGVVPLNNRIKEVDRKLKSYREQKEKALKIEDPVKQSRKLRDIEKKEEKVINSFNKRYNELRED